MTRQLPNDYARCAGVVDMSFSESDGTQLKVDYRFHHSCVNCLRRLSPIHGISHGSNIAPPAIHGVDCEYAIHDT
jgi:hypothetical protein